MVLSVLSVTQKPESTVFMRVRSARSGNEPRTISSIAEVHQFDVVSRVGNAVATRKKLKSSMRVEERRPRCYRGSSSRYMSWHVTQEPVMAASRLMTASLAAPTLMASASASNRL